jgi:hypothetical protein
MRLDRQRGSEGTEQGLTAAADTGDRVCQTVARCYCPRLLHCLLLVVRMDVQNLWSELCCAASLKLFSKDFRIKCDKCRRAFGATSDRQRGSEGTEQGLTAAADTGD